jgi:hypothetical protein
VYACAANFENLAFVAKKHPDGGYQLMLPHWFSFQDVIHHQNENMTLRDPGMSYWEFVKLDVNG